MATIYTSLSKTWNTSLYNVFGVKIELFNFDNTRESTKLQRFVKTRSIIAVWSCSVGATTADYIGIRKSIILQEVIESPQKDFFRMININVVLL